MELLKSVFHVSWMSLDCPFGFIFVFLGCRSFSTIVFDILLILVFAVVFVCQFAVNVTFIMLSSSNYVWFSIHCCDCCRSRRFHVIIVSLRSWGPEYNNPWPSWCWTSKAHSRATGSSIPCQEICHGTEHQDGSYETNTCTSAAGEFSYCANTCPLDSATVS